MLADMVVVQKATGVTDKDGKKLDVQDVLQYPTTYAGKPNCLDEKSARNRRYRCNK